MRVIIAGSRSITDPALVIDAVIESGFDVTEIICGGARGADLIGKAIGEAVDIKVAMYPITPEEWELHGKAAGHLRNQRMAAVADALVAVWDGTSPGTKHMIDTMRKAKKWVYVKSTRANCRFACASQLPGLTDLHHISTGVDSSETVKRYIETQG